MSSLAVALSLPALASAGERVPADVKEALTVSVTEALPWSDASFELTEYRVSGKVPRRGWTLELAPKSRFKSRVRAKLVPDDERERTVWVSAKIEVTLSVLVADQLVEADEPVAGRTRVEDVKLRDLDSGFLSADASLGSLVASRRILAGDPIVDRDLERPVWVERKQIVTLTIRRGTVRITDSGVALAAGREGDLINVRASASGRTISAVVRAPGVLEVP